MMTLATIALATLSGVLFGLMAIVPAVLELGEGRPATDNRVPLSPRRPTRSIARRREIGLILLVGAIVCDRPERLRGRPHRVAPTKVLRFG